jgi:uncharacterized protein
MNALCVGFVGSLAVHIALSVLRDPASYRGATLFRSLARFRRSPVLQRELWDQLRDYVRPDFHPDDRDTTELVARWRAELFGDEGSLNDKLASPAPAA